MKADSIHYAPLRRVVGTSSSGRRTKLECGHIVPHSYGNPKRRRCQECATSYAVGSTDDTALVRKALQQCITLIDDMMNFVGQMALQDYQLLNEAPINARQALAAVHRIEQKLEGENDHGKDA